MALDVNGCTMEKFFVGGKYVNVEHFPVVFPTSFFLGAYRIRPSQTLCSLVLLRWLILPSGKL